MKADEKPRSLGHRTSNERCECVSPLLMSGDFIAIDVDPGSHRCRNRDALDVRSLGRRWLQTNDRCQERLNILDQLVLCKTCFAHRRVNDAGFVNTKLDLIVIFSYYIPVVALL